MDKIGVVFGGSGYIGTHLLKELLNQDFFDKYIVADIKELAGFNDEIKTGKILFHKTDVRNPIDIDLSSFNVDSNNSWIFNFAAVHREPGHEYHEYFDTNVPGANNVNDFATNKLINNIFFTSSIAPFGRSMYQRTEQSSLYPETAYGISKGFAEKIHETWQAKDISRRLIIVRPSVIYGPKDPGNVLRMIKALKKGTFILPNGGNIIKSYGYVYGLVDSMIFTINQNQKHILYNYAENPVIPLKDMTIVAKKYLNYKKPTIALPVSLLAILAGFLSVGFKLIGKKSDIHPVRVKKAGFPTNIKPEYLINNGFEFKYGFEKSLEHWRQISPQDFE